MPLPTGTRLGPYEIVAALGAGGMGEVYKARDSRLDRDVAIKTLPAEVSSHPDRLRRFELEAQAIAAVSHPNLLAIFDIGHAGNVRFLVTELLEGETLRARLTGEPLPVETAIALGRQITAGLASAHARGIVHRDLKPENIFLTHDGFAKVLDFGLAKVTARAGSPKLRGDETQTSPGMVLGTLGYMAPEQLAGGDADERSDVFAVGAVLFEAISGRRALEATPSDTLSALLDARPLDQGLKDTGLHGPVGHVVRRCLEQDPAHRFQSMADLRHALDALAGAGRAPVLPRDSRPAASIAVLPFADMSADKSQAYFCEGMAEEIINALVHVEGLRVAARTSTFQMARDARELDLAMTARALGVKSILEGSVRTSGPRLRVTAQLVDAASGRAIWSERYDGALEDVFDIQDRISVAIVEALRVKLLGHADQRPARQTKSLDAYHAYLKGRHHRFTTYDLREAYRAFRHAAELDPSYAAAHAGAGYTLTVLGNYGFLPPQAARSQALAAIDRALALDARLAQAHAARAYFLLLFDREWDEAERMLTFTLELDSCDVEAYVFFGLLYAVQGRASDARRMFAKAFELEPFSAWTHAVTGMALLQLGEFNDAADEAKQALEARPDSLLAQTVAGSALTCLGRHDEGIGILERAVAAAPTHHWIRCTLGQAYGTADRVADAEGVIAALEREQLTGYVSPGWLALVPASLGRADEALGLFDLEIRNGGSVTTFIRTPILGKLRSSPRYHAMLAQLGLPPIVDHM